MIETSTLECAGGAPAETGEGAQQQSSDLDYCVHAVDILAGRTEAVEERLAHAEADIRGLLELNSKAHQAVDLHQRTINKLAGAVALLQRHELAMDRAIKNHTEVLNQIPGVEVHRPPEETPPTPCAPN